MLARKRLLIKLSQTKALSEPELKLEQYPVSPEVAVELLELAWARGDIQERTVADLGCGSGRLALGAALLGAKMVVAVDIEPRALMLAHDNLQRAHVSSDLILGDIAVLKGPFDTVVMNPPFGTRTIHADIRFLEHAIKIASVCYSIHKKTTRKFVRRWLSNRARIESIHESHLELPRTFKFHRKASYVVDVDIYRISTR